MSYSKCLLTVTRNFAIAHFLSGFFLFLFGWAHGLTKGVVFGTPFLIYSAALLFSWRSFQGLSWQELKERLQSVSLLAFFVVLIFLVLNFLFCLLPPGENLETDALNYHLAIPWQYYLRGAVVNLDWSAADKFPLYLQMAQLPFTVLTFPWIIKIWNLFTLPALIVLLYSFLTFFKIPLASKSYLIALTIGLALFAVQYGSAMFDLANTLYVFFAFYYLSLAVKSCKGWDLFYGALFLGMASAMKTFSPYLIFVWGLSFLIWRLCQTPRAFKRFDYAILGGPFIMALVFLSPVWLRNSIHTGNPFFPLLSDFFHSPFDNGGALEKGHYQFGYGFSLLDYFLFPIRLVLPIRKFDYWTDPLLLVFLAGAFIVFRRRWKDIHGLVSLVALFFFTAIFMISQQARFFYFFWLLIIILGGEWLMLKLGKKALTFLLLAQALVGLSFFFYFHRQAIGWLKGRQNYLAKASYSYVWNSELANLNIHQLCLRSVAGNFVQDILYFEVPVKLIQHFNTTLRLTSFRATDGCDFFMIGNQDYAGERGDPENGGILVSKEDFLRLP